MRGDQLARQVKYHAKPPKAVREQFGILVSFLKIFLIPPYSTNKAIMGSSEESSLRSWRLGVRYLDDFMRHSFKVMHDELHTVKVKISPEWARLVGERIWHESQKITKLPDGSAEITFRVAGLDQIKRWILSFGPECRVLDPEKLKEMVHKDYLKIWLNIQRALYLWN